MKSLTQATPYFDRPIRSKSTSVNGGIKSSKTLNKTKYTIHMEGSFRRLELQDKSVAGHTKTV